MNKSNVKTYENMDADELVIRLYKNRVYAHNALRPSLVLKNKNAFEVYYDYVINRKKILCELIKKETNDYSKYCAEYELKIMEYNNIQLYEEMVKHVNKVSELVKNNKENDEEYYKATKLLNLCHDYIKEMDYVRMIKGRFLK